jgi:hypothetical protein
MAGRSRLNCPMPPPAPVGSCPTTGCSGRWTHPTVPVTVKPRPCRPDVRDHLVRLPGEIRCCGATNLMIPAKPSCDPSVSEPEDLPGHLDHKPEGPKTQKRPAEAGRFLRNPAASYSPRGSPPKYHRRWWA